MTIRHLGFAPMLVFGLCAALANTAQAATGCEKSAKRMYNSCQFERKEERSATMAKCASINTHSGRMDCFEEARNSFSEAGEECDDQRDARLEVCAALGEDRYEDPLIDETIAFIDPDEIGEGGLVNNPYVKLAAGHTHMLRAESYDEEEDETSVEIVVVHTTDEVREIQGVLCRVVVDIVFEPEFDEEEGKTEFEVVEVTDDWFAQDADANVYYCGEVARNFEDGVLRDLDGSFESGVDRAEAGYLTKAMPVPGDIHRQEYALGEAEDIVEYVSHGGTIADEGIDDTFVDEAYRCGDAGEGTCLQTHDYTPTEPGSGEYKYYLPGTGFVLAVSLDDGEIVEDEFEWLVCDGDELGIIAQASCGIDEEFGAGASEELLDTLCELSNELCEDGEES